MWRKRVHFKSFLGEVVRVTFCLKSLAIQGGSFKTRNVATERLAKSDELNENSRSVELRGSSVSGLTMLE